MPADKDGGTEWGRAGEKDGASATTGGELETQRILKTFAVLLIFFSKWVKLFYDFQRQFLSPRAALFPSLFPSFRLSLSLSPFLSSTRRVAASRALSEAYFLIETAVFFRREFTFTASPFRVASGTRPMSASSATRDNLLISCTIEVVVGQGLCFYNRKQQ